MEKIRIQFSLLDFNKFQTQLICIFYHLMSYRLFMFLYLAQMGHTGPQEVNVLKQSLPNTSKLNSVKVCQLCH